MAHFDTFVGHAKFRYDFPRCQSKNRTKSLILYDLRNSYLQDNAGYRRVMRASLYWIAPVIAIWCGPLMPPWSSILFKAPVRGSKVNTDTDPLSLLGT